MSGRGEDLVEAGGLGWLPESDGCALATAPGSFATSISQRHQNVVLVEKVGIL